VPFVHGLGWRTDVPESQLRGAPAYIIGRETTRSAMLQASATRQRVLFADPPAPYRHAKIETSALCSPTSEVRRTATRNLKMKEY
jgi:hypothetical protein